MFLFFYCKIFFAVKYLNNNNIIPKDSIIVPGHSGDFLVGNHLYPFDKNKISNKSVMKQILKRHYVLKAYLKDNEIEKKLIHQIPNEGLSYSKIDNFNLKERPVKVYCKMLIEFMNILDMSIDYHFGMTIW